MGDNFIVMVERKEWGKIWKMSFPKEMKKYFEFFDFEMNFVKEKEKKKKRGKG